MSGWLLLLGVLLGLGLVCRLLHLGRVRLLPIAALALGLLVVATPPGQALSGLIGEGLVVVVQLIAWVLAPLVTLALLVGGMVLAGRLHPPPGSRGRRASLGLTLVLGLLAALVVVHIPVLGVLGRQLSEVADQTGSGLWDAALVVLLDPQGGTGP